MVNASYRMEVRDLGYTVDDSGKIFSCEGKLGEVLDGGVELNYSSKHLPQTMATLKLRQKLYKKHIPLRDCPNLHNLSKNFKKKRASLVKDLDCVIGNISEITMSEYLERENAKHRKEFQESA